MSASGCRSRARTGGTSIRRCSCRGSARNSGPLSSDRRSLMRRKAFGTDAPDTKRRRASMTRNARLTFLLLVLAQAGHSVEEYFARLYDVLVPARFVSGLVAEDRRIGFLIFNASLVAFGLWCVLGPVRRGAGAARALAWLWAVLELGNGLAHVAWAASAGAYRPGLATAPLLLALASLLAWQLRRAPSGARAEV